MFPNMPDDVFNLFMVPFVQSDGWPFLNILNSTEGTIWWKYLGGLSLHQFRQLRWYRSSILLYEYILHPVSNCDVEILIRNHVKGIKTPSVRNVERSKERFRWHVQFIERARCLCAPVIMVITNDGFRILDGVHRISALISIGLNIEVPIDAWLGDT